MAVEKTAKKGIDKDKWKTMERLKEEGFDTANKIRALNGRTMLKKGLKSEMENIYDLQDAIKAGHSEIAWLMDGEDPKPVKKEVSKNAGYEAAATSAAIY